METLRQISDGSLDDIEFPNDQHVEIQIDIKKESLTDDADHFKIAEDLPSNIEGNLNCKTKSNLQFEKRKQKVKENPECEPSFFGRQKSLNPRSNKLEAWKEEYYVDGQFVCPEAECGKKISQFGDFQQHLDRKDHVEIRKEIDAKFDKNSKTNDSIDIKDDPLEENKSKQCETDEQAYPYNFKVNEQGKFVCEKCDTLYNLKASLKAHVDEKHRNLKPFQCLQCDFACFKREHLMKHFKIKHKRMIPYEVKGEDIPIQNDVYIKGCIKAKKRGFWRKDESEKLSQRGYENVILINGKEEFKCPSCDKIFKHRSLLCTHIDQVHEKKKPHLCTKCGYRAATKTRLKMHDKQVHELVGPNKETRFDGTTFLYLKYDKEVEIFYCSICKKSGEGNQKGRISLLCHIRKKHQKDVNSEESLLPEKRNSCEDGKDMCKEIYRGSKPWRELWCKKCVEIQKNKIEETKLKYSSKSKPFTVCPDCGRIVKCLEQHIATFHGTEKLECPKCKKIFKSRTHLRDHIKDFHEKVPCVHCGKLYGLGKNMKRHIQAQHTPDDEKKFKCCHCGKGFSNSRYLKDHENIHTGEKPYKCKFCSACFADRGNHAQHVRSHLGINRRSSSKNLIIP